MRISSTTLYRWSGSVLNYEVVVVLLLTATAGGQSGPIVFPCVLIIKGEKDNKFRRSRWLRSPWVTTIKFVHIRGESERETSIWYYNVLNERPGWSGLLDLPSWLYELSPKTNTIKCKKKKSINDLNRRINLVLKYTMIYWWGLGLGRVSAFMNL